MKSSKGDTGCLVLFGLPFAAVGLVMLGMLVSHGWQSRQMSAWPTVPAKILEAKLESYRSSDGNSERAEARYEYEWRGNVYTNDRIGITRSADTIGSFQERKANTLIHAMKNRKTVSVHVNPEDPSESILYPEIRWEMVAFYSGMFLIFGGIGFACVLGAVRGKRKAKEIQILKEKYPDQPWKWRPEWLTGEIPADDRKSMTATVFFTVIWNIISLPLLLAFPSEFFEKGNHAIVFGLFFPLIGAVLILVTLYRWIHKLKYGDTVLVLHQSPGVIGGVLGGAIKIPKRIALNDGYELSLACVNRVVTGSGKHRKVMDKDLWVDEQKISQPLSNTAYSQTLIPVLFHIPFTCKPCDISDDRNQILWVLSVSSKTSGVDFSSTFSPPVFLTPESNPEIMEGSLPSSPYAAEISSKEFFHKAHARMEPLLNGGTRLVFPVFRNLSYCLSMWFFTLVWWGIIYGIYFYTGAPKLFPGVFALFGLVLLWGSIQTSFTCHLLSLRKGQLEFRGGMFGNKGPFILNQEQIKTLEVSVASQQGKNSYYHIRTPRGARTKYVPVKLIRGKKTADDLLEFIRAQTL